MKDIFAEGLEKLKNKPLEAEVPNKAQIINGLPKEVFDEIEAEFKTQGFHEIMKLPNESIIECLNKVIEQASDPTKGGEYYDKLISDCRWDVEKLEGLEG